MEFRTKTLLLTLLTAVLAGCGSDSGTNGFTVIGASPTPPTTLPPPPPPPAANNFTVTVTSVGITNKDSGQVLVIEGFPLESGSLTIE